MKQTEIADYLDLSERQLRTVLSRLGLDHRVHSLDDIRIAYIRDLREKAAGRGPTDTKERLELAKAEEAEMNTQLKARQLWTEDGLMSPTLEFQYVLHTWIDSARTEFFNAMGSVINFIESKYSIHVEREAIDKITADAIRVIGEVEFEFEADGGVEPKEMEASKKILNS